MPVKVHAIDHLVINVSDVARSVEWYRKILGMEVKVFDPGGGRNVSASEIAVDAKPAHAMRCGASGSSRT